MIKKVNWHFRKAYNWKHLPAPARPWASEVAWFEKYVVEKKKQGKLDVLVLGSTVEFRSILQKHKMNVHIVDFSREFYNILSKQPMKYQGKEKFYEQNWVTMNLGKKFDLILGDWVMGVLNTKFYDKILNNINNHLKSDGLWILRQPVVLNNKKVDLCAVAKLHRNRYAPKYSFYQTSMHQMYHCRPNPKTRICDDLNVIRMALDDAWEKKFLTDADYFFCIYALSFESGTLSVFLKRNLERQLAKYLEIVTEHHGQDPSAPWFPIYVLKKK